MIKMAKHRATTVTPIAKLKSTVKEGKKQVLLSYYYVQIKQANRNLDIVKGTEAFNKFLKVTAQ
jgi:hypothetical protein